MGSKEWMGIGALAVGMGLHPELANANENEFVTPASQVDALVEKANKGKGPDTGTEIEEAEGKARVSWFDARLVGGEGLVGHSVVLVEKDGTVRTIRAFVDKDKKPVDDGTGTGNQRDHFIGKVAPLAGEGGARDVYDVRSEVADIEHALDALKEAGGSEKSVALLEGDLGKLRKEVAQLEKGGSQVASEE